MKDMEEITIYPECFKYGIKDGDIITISGLKKEIGKFNTNCKKGEETRFKVKLKKELTH